MKLISIVIGVLCYIAASSSLPSGRIVGGETVDIAGYGYQVSLRKKSLIDPQTPYQHSCGGTIYTEKIIITAAHCVIATIPSLLKVVAGTSFLSSADGVIVPVQEIIMHEAYDPKTVNNDIAFLVLATPLPLNGFSIRSVELIDYKPIDGVVATVSGWGLLEEGGHMPQKLQAVKVPIVGNEQCNEDYEGAITEAMLCAGIRGKGGKDACTNDSGGPLIIHNKLAGVVSWGDGCARAEYPGVYADIWWFRSWIAEKVAQYE